MKPTKSINMFFKNNFTKIFALFFVWRIGLFIVLIFSIKILPLAYIDRFLGGGIVNYTQTPEILAWANFDGEHYLAIAINGYKGLEQAFFPIYPIMTAFFARPFYNSPELALYPTVFSGLFISNLSFLAALYFLWKLVRLDYSHRVSWWTLIVLILFPTAFYFGALYSESTFLLLAVTSFYAARRGNWWLAALLGAIASATRIFGILLFPALILEAWQQRESFRKYFPLALIPTGLLAYMYYQWKLVGDPLAFYRLQKIVGEQHQSGLTLLPQVYYRYVKMLATVTKQDPIYQTIILEFVTGILFFFLPIYGFFKKVRWSYLFFALSGFLTPTIQGSLSSVPRYIIVFFPSFIVLALIIDKWPKWARVLYCLISCLLLILEAALFFRGYWVA
jgi:hypothetical protein